MSENWLRKIWRENWLRKIWREILPRRQRRWLMTADEKAREGAVHVVIASIRDDAHRAETNPKLPSWKFDLVREYYDQAIPRLSTAVVGYTITLPKRHEKRVTDAWRELCRFPETVFLCSDVTFGEDPTPLWGPPSFHIEGVFHRWIQRKNPTAKELFLQLLTDLEETL